MAQKYNLPKTAVGAESIMPIVANYTLYEGQRVEDLALSFYSWIQRRGFDRTGLLYRRPRAGLLREIAF